MPTEKNTKEIIKGQLALLPPNVVGAILATDYPVKLQEITKRQRLLIDQAGKLETETTLVMIGLEPLSNFIQNLQRELEIPEARAKEIAQDVNESIFKPIRTTLEKMDEYIIVPDETPTNPAPPPEENTLKFTNSNETSLNRDQILNEIENPIPNNNPATEIKPNPSVPLTNTESVKPVMNKDLEIRPAQEIKTIPGEEVKDISKNITDMGSNIFESKIAGTTIISQQIVDIKTDSKLPEVSKKPTAKIDPYREALM